MVNGPTPPVLRTFLVLFAIFLFSTAAFAYPRCSNCNQETVQIVAIRGIAGEKKMVCPRCYFLVPRCAICRMPLKKEAYKKLADGRVVCPDDFNVGVFGQQEAEEIARETRRELERTFYRFSMAFPETNVTVSLVAADRLCELAHVEYDPRYPEVQGLTDPKFYDSDGREIPEREVIRREKTPARIDYKVYVLSGLPRARVTAVFAHEFGHVWHFQNLPLDRTFHLEGKTREAFCELLAFQLMGAMNQPFEQAVIEANLYTYGQASLLIEVEKDFGFNRILQWMKHGQDLHLSSDDLDRLKLLDSDPNAVVSGTPADAVPAFFANAKPIKIPDTLMLKGIMGTGNKKLALINNQTFSSQETAKVKIGTTNVSVQVVEIRDKSVLIRTNGTPEPTELFLQN